MSVNDAYACLLCLSTRRNMKALCNKEVGSSQLAGFFYTKDKIIKVSKTKATKWRLETGRISQAKSYTMANKEKNATSISKFYDFF